MEQLVKIKYGNLFIEQVSSEEGNALIWLNDAGYTSADEITKRIKDRKEWEIRIAEIKTKQEEVLNMQKFLLYACPYINPVRRCRLA